jgi:hypothetical protein
MNFSNWPDLSDRISLTNFGSAMTTLGVGPNQVKQTLPTCSSMVSAVVRYLILFQNGSKAPASKGGARTFFDWVHCFVIVGSEYE